MTTQDNTTCSNLLTDVEIKKTLPFTIEVVEALDLSHSCFKYLAALFQAIRNEDDDKNSNIYKFAGIGAYITNNGEHLIDAKRQELSALEIGYRQSLNSTVNQGAA